MRHLQEFRPLWSEKLASWVNKQTKIWSGIEAKKDPHGRCCQCGVSNDVAQTLTEIIPDRALCSRDYGITMIRKRACH